MEIAATLGGLAVAVVALYLALRGPIKDAKTEAGARFDKLDAKIDGVHRELTEFRIETREVLARHDGRITALEEQRPRLATR